MIFTIFGGGLWGRGLGQTYDCCRVVIDPAQKPRAGRYGKAGGLKFGVRFRPARARRAPFRGPDRLTAIDFGSKSIEARGYPTPSGPGFLRPLRGLTWLRRSLFDPSGQKVWAVDWSGDFYAPLRVAKIDRGSGFFPVRKRTG